MDYDSYSLRGGDAYFQKAWNIVNNAPEGGGIKGWKQFDGLRNRYFLAENINNSVLHLCMTLFIHITDRVWIIFMIMKMKEDWYYKLS